MVKNEPAMWETWVRSLGWEDPLEENMATHSSILAWRIPMDRGALWATVHGVTESLTQLSDSAQHSLLIGITFSSAALPPAPEAFCLSCLPMDVSESRSVVSDSSQPHGLYSPWTSPSQNTGVGSLFLLGGIFPTQGSNPGLLHCRRILYR